MRLGRESRLRMNNRRLNAERNREREPQKFPSSHGAVSASYASISLLRGRPRLRRPFLGGRPTRFGSLIRLAREPCLFGGSTVHPALRSKSIASISSVSCISFCPPLRKSHCNENTRAAQVAIRLPASQRIVPFAVPIPPEGPIPPVISTASLNLNQQSAGPS